MKINNIYILILFLCGVMVSCSTEEMETKDPQVIKGYSFSADIKDYEFPDTRANRASSDDLWTIRSFSASQDDVAGFYSLTGNPEGEDGNGPFNNIPMKYDGNKFVNDDILFNTDLYVKAGTFYYFPYRENIEYDPSITQYSASDKYGIELRDKDERDGLYKYRDILFAINSTSATSASFHHCASSIVFLRDEGFKNATDRTIKVVLNKGVSHAVAEDNNDYVKNIRFIYLNGYEKDGVTMSEDDCKIWEAWEGNPEDGPYVIKSEGSPYDGDAYDNPQYIILPSSRSDSRLSVDHIELYDDDGNLRIITNFTLFNQNSKTLYYGQRYPLIIKMQDLEAQIIPVNIKPWGEDRRIDENRKVGIANTNDFDDWVLQYNSFISSGRPDRSEENEPLLQYGDKTIVNNVVTWKFYLEEDIDLSDSENIKTGITSIFDKFDDTFEGNNHTLKGLKMSAPTPPCFIRELGSNGTIQNVDFMGFDITCSDENNQGDGGLINQCNGKVENCTIDGVVKAGGNVGLLGARGDNSIVTRCNFSGVIIGSNSTPPYIFGSESDCEKSGNSTSGIIFQPIN